MTKQFIAEHYGEQLGHPLCAEIIPDEGDTFGLNFRSDASLAEFVIMMRPRSMQVQHADGESVGNLVAMLREIRVSRDAVRRLSD